MAGRVDNYLWDIDNVTTLCTADCLSTAETWFWDVSDACSDDNMNIRGRLIPPHTVPGRILDGMNIACLRPDTDVSVLPGISGDEIITTTEPFADNPTDAIESSIFAPTDSATLEGELDPVPIEMQHVNSSNVSPRQTTDASGTGYCLIDSYSWIGSDIIRPDCSSDTSTDPQCLDPTDVPEENQRIANLYPDDLLCSECFIKMFYLRVASPYLPVLDHSDYLIDQYLDIVDVCDAKMPELFVRIPPWYEYADNSWNSSQPQPNDTFSQSPVVCNRNLTLTDLLKVEITGQLLDNSTVCDTLSTAYNVTTGDLQIVFDDPFCTPEENFTGVCVPFECPMIEVPYGATW